MKIYPLQTGTVRVKQFQLTGARNKLSRFYQLLFTQKWAEWMPIYSWLIETGDKLILVDTGETADIYREGYLPKGGLYHKAVETKISREEEIDVQLKKIGYKPDEIDTVILTHLHGDHIGGIKYFPNARFILSKREYDLAVSEKGPGQGYFKKNWPSWFQPELITYQGQPEGNFTESYRLFDNEQIIIVPTPGHSIGHQSVILKSATQTFFIGGDITFDTNTLESEIPNVILSNKYAEAAVKKVRTYVESNSCIFLSSHDKNVDELLKKAK